MSRPGPVILVILDGASEPLHTDELTSLERATTPVLDALAQLGTLHRLATTPTGLPAGSETGGALLLGWRPPGPVDRAQLEAAARQISVAPRERAVRIDVLTQTGERASAAQAAQLAADLDRGAARVHHLAGHRLLLVGEPDAVEQTAARLGAAAEAVLRWPAGEPVPVLLDPRTLVIGAPGAITGLGRCLGAAVQLPPGLHGSVDDDLTVLAKSALAALDADAADRIVVHVGAPDEAAHHRDHAAKVRAIEAADEQVLRPLVAALHERGGRLEVAIDHGCDPRTGAHDDAPTPFLRWDASASHEAEADDLDPDEPGVASGLDADDLPVMAVPKRRATADARTGRRLTERWALPLPAQDPLDVITRLHAPQEATS